MTLTLTPIPQHNAAGCLACCPDLVGPRRGEHHFGVRLGDQHIGPPPRLNGQEHDRVVEVELGEHGRAWVCADHLCCRCGQREECLVVVEGHWSMTVIRRPIEGGSA